LADHDTSDFEEALHRSREWDYNTDAPIALGIFYRKEMPTFSERYATGAITSVNRDQSIRDLLASRI
ncbi:MAG: 2-oxoacid:ferredoxin oxidoreductase subunit beta, partial [Methanoregulaceae archaeon]|nr:2-oxoacid:ferredoxin oxidoreductase subunit beta [Methanoregulaceae archaeon]